MTMKPLMMSAMMLWVGAAAGCGSQEGRSAGDCEDAADNDGDGLFDCDDEGCMGSPVCDDATTAETDDTDTNTQPTADTGSTGACAYDANSNDATCEACLDDQCCDELEAFHTNGDATSLDNCVFDECPSCIFPICDSGLSVPLNAALADCLDQQCCTLLTDCTKDKTCLACIGGDTVACDKSALGQKAVTCVDKCNAFQ